MLNETNNKAKSKVNLKDFLKNKILNSDLIKEDINKLNNKNYELEKKLNALMIKNQEIEKNRMILSEENVKFIQETDYLISEKKSLEQKIEIASNENINLIREIEIINNTPIIKKKLSLLEIESIIIKKQEMIKEISEKILYLDSKLNKLENRSYFEEFGLYNPKYDFANSSIYKNELKNIRNEQKRMIREKEAVLVSTEWTINGSIREGKKMSSDNVKLMLRSFNNECEVLTNKVTYKNFESSEKRIYTSFEQINKLNKVNSCEITQEYLNYKVDELVLAYEYSRKKEEEREEIRIQKEKDREEKALKKEVDDKIKVIDKEIEHIENAAVELELKLKLVESEYERKLIDEQIEELRKNAKIYESEKKELDYRIVHANAGYVYVISNIGSFGKNIYKIGVTRRLDPWERISELSSASVPFKFDVHALIFSYEAYKLEGDLHNKFSAKRVNMVNNRKEFFRLHMEEIKEELTKHKNLTMDFKEEYDAEEYLETLKIIDSNIK